MLGTNRKRRKEDNGNYCGDQSKAEVEEVKAQRALVFDEYQECIKDLHEYLSVLYEVKTSERDEMVRSGLHPILKILKENNKNSNKYYLK